MYSRMAQRCRCIDGVARLNMHHFTRQLRGQCSTYTERFRSSLIALISIFLLPMLAVVVKDRC